MEWVDKGYNLTASSDSTMLTFTSKSTGNCGPALDAVGVAEILATGAKCKNNGWKEMTDKYGTPFKNQGDCVSYYATGEKNLAAG